MLFFTCGGHETNVKLFGLTNVTNITKSNHPNMTHFDYGLLLMMEQCQIF